jgi:hypothetical protein
MRPPKFPDVARSNGRSPACWRKRRASQHRHCRPIAFASKPAPTDLRTPKISEVAWIECRSALARERYPPVALANLTHRLRQQAGAYRFAYADGLRGCPINCRSALAREKYPPVTLANLTHRVRQQAGSYRFAYADGLRGCPINCRSALAREKYPPVALVDLTHRLRQKRGRAAVSVQRGRFKGVGRCDKRRRAGTSATARVKEAEGQAISCAGLC